MSAKIWQHFSPPIIGDTCPSRRESEKLGREFGIEGQFADVMALQIANDLDHLINTYSGVAMTFFYRDGNPTGDRHEVLVNKTSFRRRAASIRGDMATMTRERVALYEEVAAALRIARKWADERPGGDLDKRNVEASAHENMAHSTIERDHIREKIAETLRQLATIRPQSY